MCGIFTYSFFLFLKYKIWVYICAMENGIKIRSNKTTRVFTVWINGLKYTTMPMTKEEFAEAEFNTINDWKSYPYFAK